MLWLVLAVIVAGLGVWLGRRLPAAPPAADPPLGDLDADPDVLHRDDTTVDFEATLDLHGVPGREITAWVTGFLAEALARGRTPIVIVHGKGIGVQRARVRALLARHPGVLHFGEPSDAARRRGATVVDLDPRRFGVAPPGSTP